MSASFSSNWSQDYSQQVVQYSHCSTNNNQGNSRQGYTSSNTSVSYNNSNYNYPVSPTSPMEDRNYSQSTVSPGVTPNRSPPTSPHGPMGSIIDPFGQMVLNDTAPKTIGYGNCGNGIMTAQPQQSYGQQQYTNYQTSPPCQQPKVISPDKAPLVPAQQQHYKNYSLSGNPFDTHTSMQSPPISPFWTPASPTASPPNTSAPPSNPFDMFGPAPSMPAVPPPQVPPPQPPMEQQPAAPAHVLSHSMDDEASFWADMGFGVVPSNNNDDASISTASTTPSFSFDVCTDNTTVMELDENNLPKGGEYYKARVTTPLIGAIFSSGEELRNTLFSSANPALIKAVGRRPVVSFTIDGGAADTAGICLGHVLLAVNSTPVSNTDEAVKLVASSPRPLVMEYYIPPNVEVVKTAGQCMVKYDTVSTEAPSSSIEWKGKYVVVGDMLGRPNVIYMYRSKAEYDIAVKEAQLPCRKLSVKVKQFDISHSHLFHENGHVTYPNQRNRWYYFVIVRPTGMPIKISCSSREELKPIYEGVKAYLEKERKIEERMEEKRIEERGGKGGETFY